jgi:hypothetical protein
MNTRNLTVNDQTQMELSFDGACMFQPVIRHQRRGSRARWWFEQMRQVVDRALDWQPAPPCQPEQMWFANTRGRIRLPQGATSRPSNGRPAACNSESVRQICE